MSRHEDKDMRRFSLIYDALYEFVGRDKLSYVLYRTGTPFGQIQQTGNSLGITVEVVNNTKDAVINLTINV